MSLLQSFEDFARDVTGIAEPVREVGAIFSDENQSSRIRFAQAEIAQENLYSMFCKVVGNSELPPLLIATIAMVAINNCHPFYDGNGRTARWAFNLMIWSAGGNADCYIPLHDFFIRSRGGFLIRQRIAEKTGDWSELVEYLCRIIKFYFGDPSERSSRPV